MERENITFNIPYIKLRFYAEMLEDTVLPITKTSALRGGMGEMLLRQNCVRDRNCDACMFMKACPVNHTLYTYMEKKAGLCDRKRECRIFDRVQRPFRVF